MATTWNYLPIVKWKLGERTALQKLQPGQWEKLAPLVEMLPIDAAPDLAGIRQALPAYLVKIAKEINKAFPVDQPVLIDTSIVQPGYQRQAVLLLTIAGWLSKNTHVKVIPVISSQIVWNEAGSLGGFAAFGESALRYGPAQQQPDQVRGLVGALVDAGLKKSSLHLIADLASIVKADPTHLFGYVAPYLQEALKTKCASVTIAGGSFPLNLMGIQQGTTDIVRVEWVLWELLQKQAEFSSLRFGDYAVTNPQQPPDMDPKLVNPSVAIRYTADYFFRIYKARGFKNGAKGQYNQLCKLLSVDPIYCGPAFSFGDECYDKAAKLILGGGNPSSWRRDATSHHLAFVASKV